PTERDAHEHTRSLQNSKKTGPEKKFFLSYNNQNTKCTKQRMLKAVREKGQVIYKGRPIRILPDFSSETMKARRSWADVIQTLREHKCQPRLLYSAKVSITIDGKNKIFHDKTKFTQYLSINPTLQRIKDGKHQHKEGKCTPEKARN
ncbi:mCG144886, partial [Mus musculus]